MAKVYSYIRFSTPEQEKGDSFRRQLKLAEEYCRKHNHFFDDQLTIADRGKSAFSKANLESGRLGLFLKAVHDGEVEPGSILFVESFDRISRADLFTAMGVLGQLLDSGITVVANGREYTRASVESNQFLLLEPIFTFIRGNEESATKGKRLKAAWKNKREKGIPLTSRMPAWCKLNGGVIELDEAKAATVRRIFEMAKTMGPRRIARIFNQEGVPQLAFRKRKTTGWMASYISKILYNPQVLGHFQPHRLEKKVRIPDGPLRENYFPQVITPEVFHSIQQLRSARSIEKGRVGIVRRNIFTGLAYAGNSDDPMHYVDKGHDKKKGGQYLVSDKSERNYSPVWWAWSYSHFETAFLYFVKGVDFSKVILPTDSKKNLEAEFEYVNGQYLVAEKKVSRLLQLAEDGGGEMHELRARLSLLNKELEQFRVARSEVLARMHVASTGLRSLKATQSDLKKVLAKLDDPTGRDEIREVLKRFVYRISLWPFGLAQWKRPKPSERMSSLATLPCFEVQFQRTQMRQLVIVHPKDPTKLFLSEYYDDSDQNSPTASNSMNAFEQNTEAILAMMFPKPAKKTKR